MNLCCYCNAPLRFKRERELGHCIWCSRTIKQRPNETMLEAYERTAMDWDPDFAECRLDRAARGER